MIGCLMQLLTRNMALGLSLTGIIVSPAFGYAGVGFPVLAMQAFPRAWGAILPLRWYIQILFDQASRGAALRFTAEPFAILCGITIVLALLVWLRFRSLVRRGLAVPEEAEPALGAAAPGVAGAFVAEWRRVLSDTRGVRPVRAGAGALRRLLSAALPGPDRAQHSDRGGGSGRQ